MTIVKTYEEYPEEDIEKVRRYVDFVMAFTDSVGTVLDIDGRKYSIGLDKSNPKCYIATMQRSYL